MTAVSAKALIARLTTKKAPPPKKLRIRTRFRTTRQWEALWARYDRMLELYIQAEEEEHYEAEFRRFEADLDRRFPTRFVDEQVDGADGSKGVC